MDFSHFLQTKKIALHVGIAVFAVLFSIKSFAQTLPDEVDSSFRTEDRPQKELRKTEKPFDTGNFALHHIADAHDFHLWGEGHHSVGLALPVILWTNNGLVTFMSSEFEHDDEGKVIVEEKGLRLVKMHEKIYYALDQPTAEGEYVEFNDKHEALNQQPIDLSITKNVFSLLFSVLVLLIVFIRIGNAYKKREGKAPRGLQSVLEPIIIFVRDDIAIPNLGYKYERFMPYLLTVFFFIWFNNTLGLIPIIPGGANLTGNIAVTMVLAIATFLLTVFNGNKYYWKHIFLPSVPWWLYPIMVPVEIIGIFTKPIALMIRLFANITAGHILTLSLICLIFIFKSAWVASVAVPFSIFISLIELLVAFIQAFIFTILSALFIGMAIEEHADH